MLALFENYSRKVLIDRPAVYRLMWIHVQACVEMAWRDYRGSRDRDRRLPYQSDLVSSVESEFILRQGLRRSFVRSPGVTLHAWVGRAVRCY